MIEQKVSCSLRVRWLHPENVETMCGQKEVGKKMVGRSDERGAVGDKKSWQHESLYKEVEFLRVSSDLRLDGTLRRQATQVAKAAKADDWTDLVESDRLNTWTSAKQRECHSEMDQEDEERKTIVQQILQKSTELLRWIIVPVEGQGGVTLWSVCPHGHRYPLEDNILCFIEAREEAVQQVVHCARPVRLEEPEQGLDHRGQHRPPRRKGVQSACSTTWNMSI